MSSMDKTATGVTIENKDGRRQGKGARFWVILCALVLALFFAVLEAVSRPLSPMIQQ